MKAQIFSHLCGIIMSFDALPSWTEVQNSNISIIALRFLNLVFAHKNKEEKVKLFK